MKGIPRLVTKNGKIRVARWSKHEMVKAANRRTPRILEPTNRNSTRHLMWIFIKRDASRLNHSYLSHTVRSTLANVSPTNFSVFFCLIFYTWNTIPYLPTLEKKKKQNKKEKSLNTIRYAASKPPDLLSQFRVLFLVHSSKEDFFKNIFQSEHKYL